MTDKHVVDESEQRRKLLLADKVAEATVYTFDGAPYDATKILLLGEDAFLPGSPRSTFYLKGSTQPARRADYIFDTVTGQVLKHRWRRIPAGQIVVASIGTGARDEDVIRLSRALLDRYPAPAEPMLTKRQLQRSHAIVAAADVCLSVTVAKEPSHG